MKKMFIVALLISSTILHMNATQIPHISKRHIPLVAAVIAYETLVRAPARVIKKAFNSFGEDAKDVGYQLRDTFK